MLKRKVRKQNTIKLFLDNTFEEKGLPVDRNKIKDGKGVEFEPICVFHERKPRRVFWRSPRHLILFVDGALKALRFKKGDTTMMPFWTKKEAGEFVNMEIAKSLTQLKPMTWGQFIVLLIPLAISLIILIKIALTMGAF